MKIAAYLRVSTDLQAERGLGLDVQREAIKTWAREHGHKVVSWHSDEGISGSNGLDTRDGLGDALSDLQEHRAEGIAVYRLDRLARDMILQEQLLRDIHTDGGRAFSTMPSEQAVIENDPDDPGRELIRVILGAIGQYERELIKLRLRNGRRRKAAAGGFAFGSPPYGYRSEGKELVPVPGEQDTLARIDSLRAAGTSWRAIAQTLNDEGRADPSGAPSGTVRPSGAWPTRPPGRPHARPARGFGSTTPASINDWPGSARTMWPSYRARTLRSPHRPGCPAPLLRSPLLARSLSR